MVAGDHVKPVLARRNIRVIRCPAGSGIDPVPIEAFQLVTKSKSFRREKIEGIVLKLEIALSGRRQRRTIQAELLLIDSHLLYHDERLIPAWFQSLRVH